MVTPLLEVAKEQGTIDALVKLVGDEGDMKGTPLFLACLHHEVAIVDLLVATGCDLDEGRVSKEGWSCFHAVLDR